TTESETGIPFIETMYFYSDGTFMIVMNKKVNDQITNGFAGTYTGDTTKNGQPSVTIAGFPTLSGTIENNKLTTPNPDSDNTNNETITYDRID
ncbi:MAG: hypothetical protein K2K67_04225, partial [Treponemataceae bacterium]|nr:hypothetical protein [Treponemataceae bacterium]